MSDDRFKKARKSLIDRNRERHPRRDEPPAGDFQEDEATQMVDLDRLQRGAPPPSPRNPGPPTRGRQAAPSEFEEEEATQMFEIPGPATSGVQVKRSGRVDENTAPSRQALKLPGPTAPQPRVQQVFAPDGASNSGYEGKTAFINVEEFATSGSEFSPEQASAGYEGSTQFVSIDALTGGVPQASGSIEADSILNQGYRFGPESIQRGPVTLVFAQNALGQDVVLRQIWEGDPHEVPGDIRHRLGELSKLDHPDLVSLNGVFAAQTGLWAELERPLGFRLGAVLAQHGAQAPDKVLEWVRAVADVLDRVHAQNLIYANLTPDAIWIQEDDRIKLEPFDVLSFEHRGQLGPFGPPEMAQAIAGAAMHPATDVFSLAAVATVALTGMPFDPLRLQQLDDKHLAEAVQSALKQLPDERPSSAKAFVDSLQKKGPSLNPEDWDIKIVAAIACLLLASFAGFMYWRQQQQQMPPPPQQSAQANPAAGQAREAVADPPGDLIDDPRVAVSTAYRFNPPVDTEPSRDPVEDAQAAADARQKARELIEEAKGLRDADQRRLYREALAKVTAATRRQGEVSDADRELLDELYSRDVVREYLDQLTKDLHAKVLEGNIGDARIQYHKWASADPDADATAFFEHVAAPNVRVISKIDDEEDN